MGRARRWRPRPRAKRMGERLPHDTFSTQIGTLELLDPRSVDWASVRKTAYLIHQQIRYMYPGAIRNLRQRLMIVPPERYGGQRLVTYKLEVSARHDGIMEEEDAFGNRILTLFVPHVTEAVEFT